MAEDAVSSVSGFSMASAARYAHFSPNKVSGNSSSAANRTSPRIHPNSSSPAKLSNPEMAAKTSQSSMGILVVGLGGANGTTLLAGILANKKSLKWRGPKGEPMQANYNGCITQLDSRGEHGGVGYRNFFKSMENADSPPTLADANQCAIGGWDIRSMPLGDALLDAQILDYDLVRQVQSEMNSSYKIFRGLFDPRFIGISQHETATHILTEQEAQSDAEALKCLRADIRYFKWKHGLNQSNGSNVSDVSKQTGHTTVFWSASVEPNSELVTKLKTGDDLLRSIEMSEEERGGPLPPSLMYATAAVLEGCSFVNGGSQNTLACPGLSDLARRPTRGQPTTASDNSSVYCLGTDFKAGQTKFKTAAVEYLRTMGLKPKVIASSNHLGNNDMRNLDSAKAASTAKLKVKHDIFAPWQEDELDHKVSIMFTPYINDEKRDFVEYTSLGFLDQTHTMATYTRASDSILCVPLMIDAAVWIDFFVRRRWPYEQVAKALAYLFKVPEGAAKGVDPGFFRQMEELKIQVMEAGGMNGSRITNTSRNVRGNLMASQQSSQQSPSRSVSIARDSNFADWMIPGGARIICAGLGCVDMQLNDATGGDGGEGIETFEGETSIGGGSVSMACKTLARLCDGDSSFAPPVVSGIVPLCMIGDDDTGHKLLRLLESCGGASENVDTREVRSSQANVQGLRTALSVLPIYKDGRRGCFFDAASNATFSAEQMIAMISNVVSIKTEEAFDGIPPVYGAFLFGYPHLLPLIQGQNLAYMFREARHAMVDGGITALDLNGVPDADFPLLGGLRSPSNLQRDKVIGAALEYVDILHMNEDELELLTGCQIMESPRLEKENEQTISKAVELFLSCGVAIVVVTRGKKGSYVACNDANRMRKSPSLPQSWTNCSAHVAASPLPAGTRLNTNGAGDSFTSGFLVATMLRRSGKKATPNARPHLPKSSSRRDPSPQTRRASPKKMTAYTLYMKEKYITLKSQYNNDKKAIFAKCHELWEKESPEVKRLYEQRIVESDEVASNISGTSLTASDLSDSLFTPGRNHEYADPPLQHLENEMKSLSLETAIHYAGLVAAHHVNIETRNLKSLDSSSLLQRARLQA